MQPLTILFLILLAVTVATRLWLAARQARAVASHADQVPAPFADSITIDEHRKAAAYTRDRLRFGRVHLIFDTAILVLVTVGGGYSALAAAVGRLALPTLWRGVLTLAALAVILAALDLPFSAYSTFRIEARYGFNRTTLPLFLADLGKGLLLAAALGLPILTAVLWLMARAGQLWWLYAWIIWIAFGLTISYLWPRFIAPLFNRFRALEAGELRERLTRLVAACGFTADGLFVMDGSRRSSHGNAYFTGVGRHKRIVLFDTLLDRLEGSEVEAVLAHELGHFRLHHVRVRLLVGALTSFVGFAVLGWLTGRGWFYSALGVREPSLAAALALFALVAPVVTFPLAPLSAWWSRRHEYAADRYAARQADGAALSRALVKLYRDNASTLTPDPIYSAWHDSHPPALARIAALAGAAG